MMPRTATVTTTSPVELLLISATSFKRLVHNYPGIAVHVLDALGERIPTWIGNTTS
jgi:CRP-like cAMP-binding protein